ncbi:phosphoribosylanthranilate isomerase [Verrucomicrobium sp. BvORR106]|uniref:phosphoribosylanthranilate isomerase n=1 Tax=Verrucomicrobium sp. BvORR106 TaxID=1403819 RepID=UPI00068F9DF7|nr:phosphoribosylanthranilate isomerase [Verrucomicrobium sp. BvORR106]
MPSTLIKICGVTQPEQAQAIADLGADFIGINFWPKSKRYLPLSAAAWLVDVPRTSRLVGVFVNPDLGYLKEVADLGVLSALQLHGDETPEFCAEAQSLGLPVIKAFQVQDEAMLAPIDLHPVQDILLDAYHPQERGGLGHTFPWELATLFQARHPEHRLYLAGGLTPENVGTAVTGLHPYAVDVASGVESGTPGIKDLEKVRAFVDAVRSAP